VASSDIRETFTPHVIALCRGILSTLYGMLKPGRDIRSAEEAYHSFYRGEPFVRVFGPGKVLTTADVRGSNSCNLLVNADERTGRLIVISMIDNLVKWQARSAVQNMDILFGIEETTGLLRPGQYP
jgi:N-acetyl-gamma-glutamyl-phosphate reductase